ncbi:hypothetical protein ACFE04_007864 [Oxalis oulophora]
MTLIVSFKKITGSRHMIYVSYVKILRVTFEHVEVMFNSNRKKIKSLTLEPSGNDRFSVITVARCMASGELRFRNPTLEELQFLYVFMKAMTLLHPLLQWAPEMASGNNDIVAVIISHPPLPRVSRKTKSNFNKYEEHPRVERVVELRSNSDHSLRLRECCKKDIYTEALFCTLCQVVTTFLELCCRYSLPALTVYYILTALIISSKNCLLKDKEGNILIVMVGSEVPTNLSGTTSGISSRVQVNLVRGVYQDEVNYLALWGSTGYYIPCETKSVPFLLCEIMVRRTIFLGMPMVLCLELMYKSEVASTGLKMSRPTVKSRANCKTLFTG